MDTSTGSGVASLAAALDVSRSHGNPLTLSAHARMLYRAMSQQGAVDIQRFERLIGGPVSSSQPLAELRRLGLVRQTAQGLIAVPRRQVIDELLTEQARMLSAALEHVLEQQRKINTLTVEAASLDTDLAERVQSVTMADATGRDGLYDLPAQARKELMAIHPGGQFPVEVLEHSLRRARASLQAGVALRVVHQVSALSHPASVDYLVTIERLGGRVRLRQNLPFRMLLIDRDAAVCAAPSGEGGQDTYLLRGQRVMTLLDRMFETTWVDATPLRAYLDGEAGDRSEQPAQVEQADEALNRSVEQLTPQQRTILRYLAEGETDQSIARQLGITPRTVTRRIAEIYAALGVDSRFQAGAVAQRIGLV